MTFWPDFFLQHFVLILALLLFIQETCTKTLPPSCLTLILWGICSKTCYTTVWGSITLPLTVSSKTEKPVSLFVCGGESSTNVNYPVFENAVKGKKICDKWSWKVKVGKGDEHEQNLLQKNPLCLTLLMFVKVFLMFISAENTSCVWETLCRRWSCFWVRGSYLNVLLWRVHVLHLPASSMLVNVTPTRSPAAWLWIWWDQWESLTTVYLLFSVQAQSLESGDFRRTFIDHVTEKCAMSENRCLCQSVWTLMFDQSASTAFEEE